MSVFRLFCELMVITTTTRVQGALACPEVGLIVDNTPLRLSFSWVVQTGLLDGRERVLDSSPINCRMITRTTFCNNKHFSIPVYRRVILELDDLFLNLPEVR
uniref:Putative secreted peptide n=1 Tax=Anopheles braziliensis TaxID=58242 RepID=A0A2M3ZWY9_9DIPT